MSDVVPVRQNTSVISYDLTAYEGLTPTEANFVVEYLKTGDSGKAYAIAFGVNYGENAIKLGKALLKKTDISLAVNKQVASRVNIALATDDTIISEMIEAATFDVKQLYDEYGNLKPISELPSSVTKFIKGITVKQTKERMGKEVVEQGEVIQLAFVDKIKALETLFKHRNLIKTDNKPNHLTQINIYDSKINNLSPQTREELVGAGLVIDPTDPIGTRAVKPVDFSEALDADFEEIVYDDNR